jgi:hypothetical protein
MANDPVDRDVEGKIAMHIRCDALLDFASDREAVRRWELETQLLANSTETWNEAEAKAQFLVRLRGMTADAHDARRRELIEWASATSLD